MSEPNWAHQTIWTGDNLDIMRGMNSESVDLIYLDPPFNSNRDYAAPIGSEAAGAAFKDTWTLSDVDDAWHGEIADREPTLYAIIDAAGHAHGKGMKSYLVMMAVRLIEMRRSCAGYRVLFQFRNMTVDHVVAQSRGGSDHIDNLQLLCGACNSMKGAQSQAELVVKLKVAARAHGPAFPYPWPLESILGGLSPGGSLTGV